MAASALPDRYRLEIRLGRDGDIDEWLGTDTVLDRPVQVCLIGPDAEPGRAAEFLTGVRNAATVAHPHLQAIFSAAELAAGAYAVGEWTGGTSLAHRIGAGETLSPADFLPNAAGLAEALASLHRAGHVHGAIDAGAIAYTLGHPAKLTAFGRHHRTNTDAADTVDLAAALESALTGLPAGGPPPSEVVDGTPGAVDAALREAQRGRLSAAQLAEALRTIPTPVGRAEEGPEPSRRVLATAAVLVVTAALVVLLGRLLSAGSPTESLPTVTAATTAAPAGVSIINAQSFDPFGDNQAENEERIALVIDGDVETSWRTERYRDPLPQLKPGVGFTVAVEGTPVTLDLIGFTSGTSYQLAWSAARHEDVGAWEVVAAGLTQGGIITVQLPPRDGGFWLVWLTDLPQAGQDDYSAAVAELRFAG